MRQVEAEEVNLLLLAPDHRHRLAEVGLAMPGRMDQRHEHLPPLQPPLSNIGPHDRLATGEAVLGPEPLEEDRKSTRLNSSHANISYAVFCLKKKNNKRK